jgi:hypothetical protein
MDTIEEYSNEEEFSTNPDPQITEDYPTLEEDQYQSKEDHQVESPSRIGSPQKDKLLEHHSAVPLTEIAPCEEHVSRGEEIKANLRLRQTTVSPSSIRNLKISQVVTKTKSEPNFI